MEPDQLKAIVSTDGFVLQADIRKRQIPVDKWFLLEVSWVPSEIGVDEQLAIYINSVLRVSTQQYLSLLILYPVIHYTMLS